MVTSVWLGLNIFFIVITLTCLVLVLLWQRRNSRRSMAENDKVLQSSRRIYQIILEDLDFHAVVQKIADIIPNELQFGTGVLAILDEEKGVIRRVAASRTREAQEAIKALSVPFDKIEISVNDPGNLMAKALKERKSFVTADVYDVLGPVVSRAEAQKIQSIMSTKTTLVYPIFLRHRPLGVFIASTKKEHSKLSSYELEIIDNFANVMGLMLQNSKLYTSLKVTSGQLQIANEKLKQLDKLKDDFVSVASHELRTPMTAIRSYAWMALNRPDIELSEKMKKYLSRVLISTERLINLVNDMLNVSRIEAGRIEIRPQIFDIQTLIDDVVVEVTPKANEKMVQIEMNKVQMPKVFADPDKVHQVLLNLIGNSLKFTPVDGLIRVNVFSDGSAVEISVSDNGVGISKEDLSRLFQKFGRLDNSYVAAATSGGTGLGLYISKSLVELMHGQIRATSEGLNKGATFTFSLPIATPETVAQADKFSKRPVGEAKELEPAAI